MVVGDQDAALLERIGERDGDALAILYDRYGNLLYSLSLRICRDPELAAEAVQNAFVAVWRAAATYDRSRGKVLPWLLRIARNQTLDLVRREGRRAEVPVGETDGAASPAGEDPAELAQVRLLTGQVRRALSSLPGPMREVVELAYFQGLTHSEIARHLGIPKGTVKSRIRLAVERLAALLGGRMGEEGDGRV